MVRTITQPAASSQKHPIYHKSQGALRWVQLFFLDYTQKPIMFYRANVGSFYRNERSLTLMRLLEELQKVLYGVNNFCVQMICIPCFSSLSLVLPSQNVLVSIWIMRCKTWLLCPSPPPHPDSELEKFVLNKWTWQNDYWKYCNLQQSLSSAAVSSWHLLMFTVLQCFH